MQRKSQSGFALLLIFLMAAAIGITLYAVMPAVVFEAERDKEELLVERGEQYSRAVQLYFRKFKQYPGRLEDLEDHNGIRSLRHRYVDPMSGKAEWRLIHVGPGGVFTDSLVYNKKKTGADAASVNNFITELQPVGGAQQPQGDAGNEVWKRRRGGEVPGGPAGGPNDLSVNSVAPAGGTPDAPAGNVMPAPPTPPDPNNPQLAFLPPGFQAGPVQPGGGPASVVNAAGQLVPIQNLPPSNSGVMPFPQPVPAPPGIPLPPPGVPGYTPPNNLPTALPYGTSPGAAGNVLPPGGNSAVNVGPDGQPLPGQNAAAGMIQRLLTTPRPGGLQGTANAPQGVQIGGGIAGVASTVERGGIKVYNDREKYNEWEFVYDFSKDVTSGAGNMAQQGQQPGLNGPPGLNGQPAGNGQQPFGQPGGFGGQPPFGAPQQPRGPGFGNSPFPPAGTPNRR
jgi:hypothetical protein